jgi:hypothetical protein
MVITLPIPDNPNWTFDIQLGDGIYTLRGLWNDRIERWTISIFTNQGDPIVVGDPINLNFPLFFGNQDPRLPKGRLIVVSLLARQNEDPGRNAFSETGGYRMVFVGDVQ